MINNECIDAIKVSLGERAPRSILAIGFAHDIIAGIAEEDSTRVDYVTITDSLAPLTQFRRYELAIVSKTLENIDRILGAALVARLRDVLVDKLFVLIETATNPVCNWTAAELMALGLKGLGEYHDDHGSVALYGYDVTTYKDTPDWLNASGWANPERWEKTRW